jgi:outer membrane protein
MRSLNLRLALPLAAVALLACTAGLAQAQSKVAVVNTAKVFSDMKETKDSNAALQSEQQALQAQAQERKAKQDKLEQDKAQIKPDAPQWAELNRQLVQMRTENEVWQRQVEQDLGRKLRSEAKRISDKIRKAIEEVAKAKGYDLVVAEQPEITDADLERIPPQQVFNALLARNVFYAADSIDITQDVLAKLDAGYTPGAATTPAPAAPAPTIAPK